MQESPASSDETIQFIGKGMAICPDSLELLLQIQDDMGREAYAVRTLG